MSITSHATKAASLRRGQRRLAAFAAAGMLILQGASYVPLASAVPPGGEAKADSPGTSASVSPRKLHACDDISFELRGFPANTQFSVKVDYGQWDSGDQNVQGQGIAHQQVTEGDGSATGTFQLPCYVPPGKHYLRFLASKTLEGGDEGESLGFSTRGDTDFEVVADDVSLDDDDADAPSNGNSGGTAGASNSGGGNSGGNSDDDSSDGSDSDEGGVIIDGDEGDDAEAGSRSGNSSDGNSRGNSKSSKSSSSKSSKAAKAKNKGGASSEANVEGTSEEGEQSKGHKAGLVIGLIIVLLGLGGAAGYLWWNRRKQAEA